MSLSRDKHIYVPFALPEIGNEEIAEVTDVIRSGWLTTGARVFKFEKEFADFLGVKYCLATNSCTAALHLALESNGIHSGDKVIAPVHTFTATAEVVRYLGADPVFVDVDRENFCLNKEETEKSLDRQNLSLKNPDIKAIIPVHFGGHACDIYNLVEDCQQNEIKIIEDAAHAFPAFYRADIDRGSGNSGNGDLKKIVGSLNTTAFSFYANKTITTAEGGMLATNDLQVAERVRIMRLHGINRDVWNRFSDIDSDWAYDVVAPGFKYNMPDLAAALGLFQLRKAESFRYKRQKIAEAYFDAFQNISGLILPKIKCAFQDHAWHLFVILIEPEYTKDGINRDQFIQKLKHKKIGTSVHFIPLHRMTYYRKRYHLKPEIFPNSEWIFQRCVSLPMYSAMSDEQLNYVIDAVRQILAS